MLCLPFILGIGAVPSDSEDAAAKLNSLGLFNGVKVDSKGVPDFALNRTPTRAEAAAMLVRLIGKEAEALSGSYAMPFTDVPEWAVPYVSYAYENKLILGVDSVTFAGNRAVTASEYITFILRALGYVPGADFEWDRAWVLSDEIGITSGRYNSATAEFLRGDIALISLNALDARLKNSDTTLSCLLIEADAFTETAAKAAGVGVIDDSPVPLAERMQPQSPKDIPSPGALQLEREVFILINKERAAHGLHMLDWDSRIADVARAHCADMVNRSFFNHINPDGQRPSDRKMAADITMRYSAENIARGYRSSEAVVAAWMASPSHRAAILSEAPTVMGVGFRDYYWAVNFVGF